MGEKDKEWEFHLRTLSSIARDSNLANDPASDPSLLNSVLFYFLFNVLFAFKCSKLDLFLFMYFD